MVGRLRPGITPAQAQDDAERVAQEIMRNYPADMASLHISSVVRPLQEETVEQSRPLLRTLFLAVAVVLLIACVNLAGLMLVRAIRRQRETAVRLAFGASAMALLRQAVLESLCSEPERRSAGAGACRGGAARGEEPAAGKPSAYRRSRIELECGGLCVAAWCDDRTPLRIGSRVCRPAHECERHSERGRPQRYRRRAAHAVAVAQL
jgi:hypothetical protein